MADRGLFRVGFTFDLDEAAMTRAIDSHDEAPFALLDPEVA
jgi:hypothetical protein